MVSFYCNDIFQIVYFKRVFIEGPLKKGFCQRATLLKLIKHEICIYEIIFEQVLDNQMQLDFPFNMERVI